MGDNWRSHWDSLRLYSPARVAGLPGMRFPAPPASYPTKDQMADFLETYAASFDLPVRTGVRVTRLARRDGAYLVTTDGPSFRCDNVIVASGTFGRTPYVPGFTGDLDPGILQLHSSAYKNPAQLRPGRVLVVGASRSGGEIAYETAMAGHPTVLSGRIHGEVPFDIEGPAGPGDLPGPVPPGHARADPEDARGPQAAARDPEPRRPAAQGQAGRPDPGRGGAGGGADGRGPRRPSGARGRPGGRGGQRRLVQPSTSSGTCAPDPRRTGHPSGS